MCFSKLFDILQIPQNLISFTFHFLLVNMIGLNIVMDHIKNLLIEIFYDNLGKDLSFKIWWTSFVFDNLGV